MLAGSGRQPPHKSTVKLTAAEAAAQRALYPIPNTTTYEYEPETDAERAALAKKNGPGPEPGAETQARGFAPVWGA